MPTTEDWHSAVRRRCVKVVPGGAQHWMPVRRADQLAELERWATGKPREKGWLHLAGGVPSHFVKRNGEQELLRTCAPLKLLTYNVLTSTPDGDADQLSVFERELEGSGKYRFWRHRRDRVRAALRGQHVVGLVEVTRHMLADIQGPLQQVAFYLKPGNYDGSAVLIDTTRLSHVRTIVKPLHDDGRPQFLLATLLHDRAEDLDFWLVVLHLKSDGLDANGSKEGVRVAEAHRAYEVIQKEMRDHPVVVVGDLNSDAFLHPVFEAQQRPHVLTKFPGFTSVLPVRPTYVHFGPSKAFDYVLVRRGQAVRTRVPEAHAPCPNEMQGSDHLPCYAELVLEGSA